ncbi:WD40 domain-containing protein [Plectosphaerella plurivora]|uniref:WD40 domain-containing protein n=1 Tax=Plectosphaerella plurivora TaxID=936078 RepID=A0A9P8VJ71_9PEZI|nr:WD40 domain-containing protein [Plectosphaerella plurivora]
MHFSPAFKASPHCCASPDGTLIATLLSSKISVRSVESLETVHTIVLPSEATGPVYALQWSPSSSRLLVALLDQVHIFSALDNSFRAVLRIAQSGLRPTHAQFGARDSEIFIIAQFGLKLTICDTGSSKTIEINNPKFHHPSSAPRGLSLRPKTGHLSVITRVAGKDLISIHESSTRQVLQSWSPDTADAQEVTWTPDGRWLVVTESPSQGHKLLFYTPDGQLFKSWTGPSGFDIDEKDFEMGSGVRVCQFSSDASRTVVGDHTRDVYVLDTMAVTDLARLRHPQAVTPTDTVQVWQEQLSPDQSGASGQAFVKATQTISAPSRQPQPNNAESKEGCLAAAFDASGGLVATRLDEYPSTVWIWDLTSSELRAVLIFHNTISTMSWHPTLREELLIACEGELYDALPFVWNPLSEGPRSVDFLRTLPDAKTSGKTQCSWLNLPGDSAILHFSDYKHTILASLAEADQPPLPWQHALNQGWRTGSSKLETPLMHSLDRGLSLITPEDILAADDTFAFKRT